MRMAYMSEEYKFLKLKLLQLEDPEEDKVTSLFFDKESSCISNANQYIRNNDKNVIKSEAFSDPIRVTISNNEKGLSYLEEVDFNSGRSPFENEKLFNPLNNFSFCSSHREFIHNCYPEYALTAKNSSILTHENQCYIVPEGGKSFYIRIKNEEVKFKPQDIFPRRVGITYTLGDKKRIYNDFGYYQQKEGQDEIRFENMEICISESEMDKFLVFIEDDNSISLSLNDIQEDRFIYLPKGDLAKEGNRIRVFEWSGTKKQ